VTSFGKAFAHVRNCCQVDVPCSVVVVVVVVDTESVGITRVLVASVVDLSSCFPLKMAEETPTVMVVALVLNSSVVYFYAYVIC
jgi:hypothetical protein